MKSSKLEKMFEYNPPIEESKTLSPFTYYQPFQSTFDPEFTVQQPQSSPQVEPSIGKRIQPPPGSERGAGSFTGSGWRVTGCYSQFPLASTSGWGEHEGRTLCNTTWRNPIGPGPGPGPSCPTGAVGPQPSTNLTSGGIRSCEFPSKREGNLGSGGQERHFGRAVAQKTSQPTNFDESYNHSSYYPLVLRSLGKNVGQNPYRSVHNRPMMCNFCKNNKEVPDIYLNHYLYDPETKILSCPVLRKHVCEICGMTGDQAHTLQYCPVNKERGLQSKVPVLLKTRTITNSTGKIRRN